MGNRILIIITTTTTPILTTTTRPQAADPLGIAGGPHQGRGRVKARLRVLSPGLAPAAAPSRPDGGVSRDTDPRPVQQPRAGVTRYRRHGDPNPRLRGHRQRQPIREMQDSSPGADDREGPAEVQVQQRSSDNPVTDQLQDRASPHQTPIAVVTPTHLSTAPAPHNMQPHPQHTPPDEAEEDLQEQKMECEEEPEEVKEKDEEPEPEQEQAEDDADRRSTTGHSGCSHDDAQTVGDDAEERAERVEEDQEEAMDDTGEDIAAQGSEITDLCSDTESAASLSMDGPLHSPPPLHSPTPPSSPDVPPFPQLDHFSEDASMSPVPDNDLLPEEEEEEEEEEDEEEEEEEDEDCSESCSLSHCCSESYPKTYADFYSESHQKSYSEPKSHPNSFPEPLKTSYPELHREPRRQPGWRAEPNEAQQESRQEPFTSHRQENVQKGTVSSPTKGSHYALRQGRDRGSHHSPLDRSVGCRLHHYDGQSDGEGDGADRSPVPRSCRQVPRQTETQARSPLSGQSSSGEAQEERSAARVQGEEGMRGSGDAISMAIKDIKEAIEEVKTKTIRSPYTPDHPVEPIWVMRQEVSPTEDVRHLTPPRSQRLSLRPATPPFPLGSRSVPLRAESARALHPQHYHQQPQHNHNHHHHHQQHQGHHPQQRDAARPPQTYAKSQPYAHMPPSQPQQRQQHQHQQQSQQHQQLPAQQPRPQVQPLSSPQQPSVQEIRRPLPPFPTFVDVPGPCDPEDLIDGIIFAATYLGCTHLLSERTPTKSARMQQAQEAMNRVRAAQKQAKNRKKPLDSMALDSRGGRSALHPSTSSAHFFSFLSPAVQSPDGESPSTAEVDLFMSTQRIKVLNADTQESLMDLPLRTISYIADIGNMVVLMARGKMVRSRSAQENLDHTAEQTTMTHDDRRLYRMICHVFESEDAQLIAQSIGQSFSVAYQEFLRANGIDPEDLSQREYSDLLNTQDMYNDDLIHFSKSENCRDVYIEKQKGEILGVVIVESGWGSILPTVIIASMMHAGPAEKSGRLNIGDQIMTINGTSLVGLPLSTCQSIIKGLKSQSRIKMNIVRCPPVTMVLIRRPDLRYQLGFSVQNGIICSLMRGGIAERGGVRVGHRIIEINSQSVVATPHEKIVQILSNAMGEESDYYKVLRVYMEAKLHEL
ncbi:hypothetical protein L3Q82_012298 [Scortum barcoo]|uniref:Uncharacterized protein n=1 Tax=Scortum barcoo TaxID=214431 RepID=A0ACB8W2P4_9TELE|nr:hypothetical protein L3Q82_012298 [Scortum barcoo]